MSASNCHTFEWKIKPKMLTRMLNAKNGETWKSPVFSIKNYNFTFHVYPNGDSKARKKSFIFYVALSPWPKDTESIILCKSQFCEAMAASFTSINTYTRKKSSWAWNANVLLLSELIQRKRETNIKCLTIGASMNILNIDDTKQALLYSNNIKCEKKQRITWNITDQLLSQWKAARNGQQFESKIFDGMWMLICFPNGFDRKCKGFLSVMLQLCGLPTTIKQIKVKYNIQCVPTYDIDTFNEIHDFSYCDSSWGPNKFMKLKSIKDYTALTLTADIEIIEQLDNNKYNNDNDVISLPSKQNTKKDRKRKRHRRKRRRSRNTNTNSSNEIVAKIETNKNNKGEESESELKKNELNDTPNYVHEIGVDFDSFYLSKQQISSCDKIDYQRVDGKWCAAKIEMIKPDRIIMEDLHSKESVIIKTNNSNVQQPRFALFGSISTRPVMTYAKFQAFPLNYQIAVNGKRCKVMQHQYIENRNIMQSEDNSDNVAVPCTEQLLGQLKVLQVGDEHSKSFWIHPDNIKCVKMIDQLSSPPPLQRSALSAPIHSKKRFRDNDGDNLEENGDSSPPRKKKKFIIKCEPIDLCDLSDTDKEEIKFEDKHNVGKEFHYTLWTAEDIICWIIELESGRYKKYEKLLLDTFNRREICGKELPLIKERHLEGWGMVNFRDCTCLYNHIQNLINMS